MIKKYFQYCPHMMTGDNGRNNGPTGKAGDSRSGQIQKPGLHLEPKLNHRTSITHVYIEYWLLFWVHE